jgi:hypothetical protein
MGATGEWRGAANPKDYFATNQNCFMVREAAIWGNAAEWKDNHEAQVRGSSVLTVLGERSDRLRVFVSAGDV